MFNDICFLFIKNGLDEKNIFCKTLVNFKR